MCPCQKIYFIDGRLERQSVGFQFITVFDVVGLKIWRHVSWLTFLYDFEWCHYVEFFRFLLTVKFYSSLEIFQKMAISFLTSHERFIYNTNIYLSF